MYKALQDCNLFDGLNHGELEQLFNKITYQVKKFSKGDLIAQNREEITSLKIIVEGSVKGEMIDFSGKTIKIEDIEGPRSLAPAFLFGKENTYPVDIVANNSVVIVSIPKAYFLKMLSVSEVVLHNYLDIISSRTQFLTGKLKLLSFNSIKGKLAQYLLSLSKHQADTSIEIPITQNELSELFGVTRPSLSRALREMNDDGIIKAKGRSIKIIDKASLSSFLR